MRWLPNLNARSGFWSQETTGVESTCLTSQCMSSLALTSEGLLLFTCLSSGKLQKSLGTNDAIKIEGNHNIMSS